MLPLKMTLLANEKGINMKKIILIASIAFLVLGACSSDEMNAGLDGKTHQVAVEGNFAENLQTALIEASVGSIVKLPAGTFKLTDGLSLDVKGVTISGAGAGSTILDFSGQQGAGEGLLVTSNDVILENFTIRDTAGDGIKSKGADGIIYRDLTVEWTGEPDAQNGAYGVYPVDSAHVLIDNVTVRGASDAGIYVGQSKHIIVRNSLAEYNVAGIEIENSSFADVHNNTARHNTGGILVFDLPDLPVMGGHSTRIFDNDIHDNNTPNFAPPGNIVASVPPGTGVMIMANENVHIFENRFADNQTVQIIINAYINPFTDKAYNPLPRNISVHDNSYTGGGNNPQGLLGEFSKAIGGQMTSIVWDGVTKWPSTEARDINLAINEADDISFFSLGVGSYPIVEANLKPNPFRPKGVAGTEPDPVVLPQDK